MEWTSQRLCVGISQLLVLCVCLARTERRRVCNIPKISPVVISRAIENEFVVFDDVGVWWGGNLVHLAVSPYKDDFLVIGVKRHDVVFCYRFRVMVFLLPILDKLAHFLFQCLQEALGCFGLFEFLPKLLGHFASSAIGRLLGLCVYFATRRFRLFLLSRCLLGRYMNVP